MNWISRLFDKTGAFGAVTAAMGCAACFPALGHIAAILGLGFLAQYEGIFINTLIPAFAWLSLVANILLFVSHQQKIRLVFGVAGPIMILLTLYPLWPYAWSTYLFYAGLVTMLIVAAWDMILPATLPCAIKNKTSVQEI